MALYVAHPAAWVAAFVLMGALHARMAILMHEAAHKLLFTNKRANDWVGRWLAAYPGFVPMELYRRSHFAHHREEFGPDEPDLNLYEGYPITRASLKRKLWRDLRGTSGWKNLKVLLGEIECVVHASEMRDGRDDRVTPRDNCRTHRIVAGCCVRRSKLARSDAGNPV